MSWDSEELISDRVQCVSFLVLDDVGREYRTSSGFVESRLGELLRDRMANRLVTSITTNLNPQEFRESYGEATAQLVVESTYPLFMEGENMRERKRREIAEIFDASEYVEGLEGEFKGAEEVKVDKKCDE